MADELITKKITEVQNFANGDLGTIIQVQGDEIGQTNVGTLKQDITNSVVSELTETGGVSLNLVNMKGTVPTYANLPAENELNDAYQVEADGLVYVYTEDGFQADGEGFMVQPEPTGVVAEGNPNAVSGGEVYKSTLLTTDLQTEIPLTYRFNEIVVTTTGIYFPDTSMASIDLTPIVDSEEIIIYRSGNSGVAVPFYDSDKNYIGRVTPDDVPVQRVMPLPGSAYMAKVFSNDINTRNADFLEFKVYQKNNPLLKLKGIYNSSFIDLELTNSDNIYHPSMVLEDVVIATSGILSNVSNTQNYAMAIVPLDSTGDEISISRQSDSGAVGAFIDSSGTALEVIVGGLKEATLTKPVGAKWLYLNVSSNPNTREQDINAAVVADSEDLSGDNSLKKILKINGYDLAIPESNSNQKRIYPTIDLGGINSQGIFNGVWYNRQYQITINYIDFSLNSRFVPKTSIECECRVSWYDANYEHTRTTDFYPTNGISFARNENEIYGKLMFRKSENLEDLPTFDFYIDGIFTENWDIKNVRNADGYQRLMVHVNVANVNSTDLKTNDVQDFENILPDYGLLALPENYSNTGEPTRLIIYCHGAGVNYDINVTEFPASDIRPEYWLSEGCAVMDIEGNPFDNTNEHFYIPQAIQSYISAYEFVLKAYNIKADGVFLGGRSMGGGMVFDVLQSRIPVIAACPLVPVANTLLAWNYMNQARRTFTANHLGITDVSWTNNNPMTLSEWDGLKNNFDKLVKYSPMWRGIESLPDREELFSVGRINSSTQSNQEEEDFYGNLHFKVKAPIKLFGVEDDATVPSKRNSELMYKMLVNGGNICELRLFEEGGHHFEIDNPACLTDWTNTRGQLLEDVPVVYIEMLQFWRRYELN